MVRTVALLFGIVFLAVGILGFVPGAAEPATHEGLTMTQNSALLLGLFPVNLLHNVVHILFGLWGLAAYRSVGGSIGYFRAVAVIYALLTILGLLPQTNTLFGLVPLHGNDVWLHALLAIVAAYFGFVHRERAVVDA
ncbi:MAG: DUF4383 domain-containing protein [Allosphingosinicella sp.]|uniref:DUF4383 domain-containing protein n=1 Tax=Allosphingosinicella sp. TaxID=2823234 RepID=UPI003928C12A